MQQSSNHSCSGPSKVSSGSMSKELETEAWGIVAGSDSNHALNDASLFSSSLPVLRHEKLDPNDTEHDFQSVDDASTNLNKLHSNGEGNVILDDCDNRAIGSLLPDDEDELLSGIMDGFDPNGFSGHIDDMEEYDFFGSVGGLELESDQNEDLSMGVSKMSLSDSIVGNGIVHHGLSNGVGTINGEHPYGEHPSRTLFVRNINSNVEDAELRAVFEQYGDIRTLYTSCKHRGFVMISYYDIRAARTAMRALQNKPLRRRKLDIHFSIPKDNPSDKDINQGTLVVFNLDPSVSNDDLRQIFGAYGEIKEIRETPHKRYHKFIEFYDVRAAEAALRSLNRSDIAGKRIKLEPSRPGGARRNIMLQLNQDLDQDESRGFPHQAALSIANSPPGNWPLFGSPIELSPLHTLNKSPEFRSLSPTFGNHLPGLASLLHPQAANSAKVPPIGKDYGRGSRVEHIFMNGNLEHGATVQQSHSLPESKLSQYSRMVSSFGASSSNGSGIETLSGPQFLWGSPNLFSEQSNSSAWQTKHPFTSNGQSHVLPYTGRHRSILGSAQHRHHHVGSAPSDVPIDKQFGFHQESPETSFMNPATYGGIGLAKSDRNLMLNMGVRGVGFSVPGNMTENGSTGFNMMSSPRLSPIFLGNGHYLGFVHPIMEDAMEHGRTRRVENNRNQIASKQQFQLDLDKITRGEDARTTLMIKNIPNKYTSKMLIAAIDENYKGTYDFFYLPIDFKNKCNVGYAFINMLFPSHIIPFYQSFNGKKWEKFNSEKIASLAYARIQGKVALINHFQNSSLMNEDKRCRPILFHSAISESGDQIIQEHLPSTGLDIQVLQANESGSGDLLGSPTKDGITEKPEKS